MLNKSLVLNCTTYKNTKNIKWVDVVLRNPPLLKLSFCYYNDAYQNPVLQTNRSTYKSSIEIDFHLVIVIGMGTLHSL